MTDEQDDLLERQQNLILKYIYGPKISAGKMRVMSGLPTLRQRRIDICDRFAEKAKDSPRFSRWFPKKTVGRPPRKGVVRDIYIEKYARCDRLKNSPVFYMRRRLNGKPGRSYGARNRFWRER